MTFSIVAEGLRKTYRSRAGEMHALDGVDLVIREGERVGIIGENGAGKSTLLRIVAGLSQPSAGKLEVSGRVHAVLTLGIGLREELSGRENLRLDAEVQGLPADEIADRVEEMADFADLGPFIDEPVRTYSSGMKSRIAFAGLIHIDPEILLIDEALSAGDYVFQRKASRAVRSLCARGRIVLVVSHSQSAIVDLCSRCIWLRQGRILADGDPAEVTAAYAAHIRRREEERLAADFVGKYQDWQADGAARIAALHIAGADGSPRHLFRPDDPAAALIELDLARDLARPYLRLVIERMDGLLVSENAAPGGIFPAGMATGRHEIRAALPRILLGPGLYQIEVEIGEGDSALARRSLPFKVDTDMPVIGGRPVLLAPMGVTVARVEA